MRLNMNTLLLAGAAYVGYKYFLHGNLSSLLGGGSAGTPAPTGSPLPADAYDKAYQLSVAYDVRGPAGGDRASYMLAYYQATGSWPSSRDEVFNWLRGKGYWSDTQGWLK